MPDEQTIIEHIPGRYERDRRIPHPGEIAVAECAGAVTLRGTVASPGQRRAAVHVASSVSGGPGLRSLAGNREASLRHLGEELEIDDAVFRDPAVDVR